MWYHTIKISYDNYSMCSVTYKKLLCLYQWNHLNNTTFVIGNCIIISGSVPLFSTNFLHVHAIIASSVRCLFVGSAYRMTKIKRIIYIFLIYKKKKMWYQNLDERLATNFWTVFIRKCISGIPFIMINTKRF